ncbi:MAG: cytochrome c family protein [SAR116 cluster bacterium]|jgi:cytochrome c|nr:cytochrome c family protein [SAR116 cluster bacterium]|tara:strand:- start:42 stop:602 length:561 start_codon:yes stop_codon:yes gene_type:complete
MDSLKFNKIAAGILCAGLLIMGFIKVGDFLVKPQQLAQNAYPIKIEQKKSVSSKTTSASVIEPILALLSKADTKAGEKIAKKCTACHVFKASGPNKVGPNLYNIVNKSIGSAEFSYSKAFKTLKGNWSYEELNKFLYKPKNYIKGTKMNFAGLKKLSDRANLIAWLRIQADNPESLPTDEEIEKSK